VRRSRAFRNPLLRWWLRDPIELWSFKLAAAYMRRDRDIKMRLYPSLTIFLVFPVISLLDRNRGGFSAVGPFVTVWMLALLPYQALQTLQMSQHYVAADIFAIAPLQSAAPVFHGVRKATIIYLLLPALTVAGLLIAYLTPGGLRGLQLALPGLLVIPVLSLAPGLIEDYLPLSRPAARGEQSSRNIGLMLVSMVAMTIVLAAAYIASQFEVFWYLMLGELFIVIAVYYSMNRIITQRSLIRH
jgi:hypothetical protein